MFYGEVVEWIEDLEGKGLLQVMERDMKAHVVDRCVQKMESVFKEKVFKQLGPSGKAAEFERMLLWDTQYAFKYLNQMIPQFYTFRSQVIEEAKEIIWREILAHLSHKDRV